jgi:molybdopterin/thiamine biosynthesis adenylyltransferase
MSAETRSFDYFEAFSRNVGWITRAELESLRSKRVAIAGLGGVGGLHLLTLARLGVGKFSLAEYDRFELANFNRQVGATVSSLGRPKLDVLIEMARDINPELDIRSFPEGVNEANLPAFLDGADLYVDSLDYFAFKARRATYAACHRAGIPTTIAVPLGMGVSALTFLPGGMTFEDFFCVDGLSDLEQSIYFLVGLSPAMLQRSYVADPTQVDLASRKGPSTPMACQLCAGVASTEALKILLKRGKVLAAPHGFHYDAYRNKYVRTWRPGGNRNPIQRLMISIIRARLASMGTRRQQA